MRRIVVFAMIFALLGAVALAAGRWSADAWERLLATRVAQSFETLQIDWAEAEIDGFAIELHGHAPDAEARALAVDSLSGITGGIAVTDRITVEVGPAAPRPALAFDILRDEDGITLTGNFAGAAMRQALLDATGREVAVHDFTGARAERPPAGWGAEIAIAGQAVRTLDLARVAVRPGRVEIEGIAPDVETRDALAGALAATAGARVELLLDLRVPRRVILPFTFAMQRRPGEATLRFEACAARDEAERAELEALVDRLDPAPGSGRCEAGLGGPEGDWTGAVAAGVAALEGIVAGRLAIEGNRVLLTGFPPTGEDAFTAAMTGLAGALPDGFELTGRIEAAPEEAWALARLTYWMRAARDAEGKVTLEGVAPGGEMKRAIAAYAGAIMGTDGLSAEIGVSDVPPPPGWHRAALAALSGLAALPEGAVNLTGERIELTGRAPSPEAAAAAHRVIAAAGGHEATSRITVDIAAALAARELPARACAARIGALLAATPILFEAGARSIAAESRPLLPDLAATLALCPEAGFVIAGHTDSQGADDMNLRLSRARAEAVLDALVEAGVSPRRLAAKGFGETEPVADNGTAEGRALNRRIEFRPVGDAPEPESEPEPVSGATPEPGQ